MGKLYGPKFWGEKLCVSSSTAQRYMRKGIIPNAVQTAGGHWRAPYTYFAMQEASIAAGILTLEQDGDEMVWRSNTRLSSELLKCFDGVFDVNSPVNKRGSLPYRLAMALSRGIDCLPVTLDELDYCDGKFREIVASDDRFETMVRAMQCPVFAAWHPKDECIKFCRKEVADGRINYVTLVVAHVLSHRTHQAAGTNTYAEVLLANWRILKGKKIANLEDQAWEVDEDDILRPRLKWVEGSMKSMFRVTSVETRREAACTAAYLLRTAPPPLPQDERPAKQRNTIHRDD
jgi:hypothetical protein